MIFTDKISVNLIQKMGGDHMVVAAARVSTTGEDALKYAEAGSEDECFGLINYMMKHRHGSPFESSAMTFFVHAPIFVWRQWHRHRIGFSYNEESGRYKKLKPTFWIPKRERKLVPVEGFKSARPKFKEATDEQYEKFVEGLKASYRYAYGIYQSLLRQGFGKEAARTVLPTGLFSSCWVTTNPRALMHFLSLRVHSPEAKFVSYPQAEIEEAAIAVEKCLETGWPLTYKAFIDNGRVAP